MPSPRISAKKVPWNTPVGREFYPETTPLVQRMKVLASLILRSPKVCGRSLALPLSPTLFFGFSPPRKKSERKNDHGDPGAVQHVIHESDQMIGRIFAVVSLSLHDILYCKRFYSLLQFPAIICDVINRCRSPEHAPNFRYRLLFVVGTIRSVVKKSAW